MNIDKQDNYIVITPSDGNLLTDGEIVADGAVYAPIGGDTSNWREISIDEYEQTQQEGIKNGLHGDY